MYRIYDREPGTPPLSDEQFYELVYPDDRASVLKAEKAALEGKNAIHLEFRAVLPDGTTRHLETRGNTEYDAAGAPIRMFGTTQDITELRHTEARLRLREAQLSAIFDSAPLMMSLKSRDGRFLRANPLVCSVFGFTEKDVLGKTSGELLGPEQGKFYGDLDQEVIATKSPKQYVDVVDLDGDTRHHLDVKFPVFDEDGEVAQIGLVSIDVTKRIEAERALRESRQRLAEAERIAHVGHWMAEIASGKLICSEGLYRIFGLEPDDRSPSAAWFYGMVHPEDQALVRKAEAAALARERPYHVEFRIVRADGAIRHLESRAEAECDAAGNLTRLFGVTQDITELRQTEAQLREAQKLEAIGRLTGGVAHDFNNLLGIIIGNLDLLAAELEPGSRRRTLIDRALKAAELGGSVTQHLLAFSRQQALQPQTVRPEALVQQAIPLLQRAVGDAIGLRMTMVDEPWICSVDPAQLETALINLAVNARDAMPEGGEIIIEIGTCSLGQAAAEQIGALSAGEYVTVSLRDTGTGMPPAVIARAFDPFFTTKEIGKGTGLGLSMVQGFCRQSGGDAAIESEVGRGTTVRLYLPRSRDAWDKPVPPRAEPSLPDQGETLLVVEDNPDLREYMFEALRSLGYQPVVAESGKEALTRLAEVPQIAAVVCDVVLSGPMSGFEFAREARRRRRDLQFLFVSGYADAANAGDVLRELEADFLPKPFRRNELGRLVQSALVRTRARVAREA
jgi:PAS domain S-box-containing protein